MIVNFSVKNFRSFSSFNTLDLSRGENKKPQRFTAIYGPNASGKSNIAKALSYMKFAMLNEDAVSGMQTLRNPLLQRFALDQTDSGKPSFFEMTIRIKGETSTYRYGFEVDSEKIISEWLIENANRGIRHTDKAIFTREAQRIKFDPRVPKRIKQFAGNVPVSVLALPRFANNNLEEAKVVTDYIRDKVVIVDGTDIESLANIAYSNLLVNPVLKEKVLKTLHLFDTSIIALDVENTPVNLEEMRKLGLPEAIEAILMKNGKDGLLRRVKSVHNVYNSTGDKIGEQTFDVFDQESLGTQKLIPLITFFMEAMDAGYTIVIDEFGNSLHPFYVRALVELFNREKDTAQLIVMTHETYLLNQDMGLKPNQIWLVEKDQQERSQLTSLADYKPKSDARLDKQYLEGRYGAVPVMLDLNKIEGM